MKRLMKRFENLMIAITFAESGEFETAKEQLGEQENWSALDAEVVEAVSESKVA